MRKNFGVKTWLYPMPVLIVAAYDEAGVPNAMNAAWGGQWDAKETLAASDFVGIVSAKNDPQKMQKTGWIAVKSENVASNVR